MVMNWENLEKLIASNTSILLYGPPGTGKTRALQTTDSLAITLTQETPAAELRGHFVPKGGEFVWMDGPALTGWKKGIPVVFNEINEASGDALTFMYALLDDAYMAKITLPTGETVRPSDGFCARASMNGEPGDLPAPLLDRFSTVVYVDTPHPQSLVGLTLADVVLSTIGSNDKNRKVSLRQAKHFDYLTGIIGAKLASQAVFAERGVEILDALKIAGKVV